MALKSNESQADFNSLITQSSASRTPDINLLTGTTGTIHTIILNNGSGSGTNYLQVYDDKEPTYGTSAPVFCCFVAASAKVTVFSKTGLTISTALSVAAGNAGGTASGGGAPSGTFSYTIYGS